MSPTVGLFFLGSWRSIFRIPLEAHRPRRLALSWRVRMASCCWYQQCILVDIDCVDWPTTSSQAHPASVCVLVHRRRCCCRRAFHRNLLRTTATTRGEGQRWNECAHRTTLFFHHKVCAVAFVLSFVSLCSTASALPWWMWTRISFLVRLPSTLSSNQGVFFEHTGMWQAIKKQLCKQTNPSHLADDNFPVCFATTPFHFIQIHRGTFFKFNATLSN